MHECFAEVAGSWNAKRPIAYNRGLQASVAGVRGASLGRLKGGVLLGQEFEPVGSSDALLLLTLVYLAEARSTQQAAHY